MGRNKAKDQRRSRKKAMRYQKHIDAVNGKMRASRFNWGDGPARGSKRGQPSYKPSDDPLDEHDSFA